MKTSDENTMMQADALKVIGGMSASGTLEILRDATGEAERFVVTHRPPECPDLPPPPPMQRADRRAHQIDALGDLADYVRKRAGDGTTPVAFYRNDGVTVCLDEASKHERETVRCGLERHPRFVRWSGVLGTKLSHADFINFLRINKTAIGADADFLCGQFASLRGSLVHDADDYLDEQKRSVQFTVKRRAGRGQSSDREVTVEDVPTSFRIKTPILIDDQESIEFTVIVRMTGSEGAQIIFTLQIEDLDETVNNHIDERLRRFAEDLSASVECIRGTFAERPWAEPKIPAAISTLMRLQALQIAMQNDADFPADTIAD